MGHNKDDHISPKRKREENDTIEDDYGFEGLSSELENWKNCCSRFYLNDDKNASKVMEIYESLKNESVSIVIEDMETTSVLQECGLSGLLGDMDARKNKLLKYETVKNAVRSKFHKLNSSNKYNEFVKIIKKVQRMDSQETIATCESQVLHDVSSKVDMGIALNALSAFRKKYIGSIGIHPFFHGLSKLFENQLKNDYLLGWEVCDNVFVESGTQNFTRDCVELLGTHMNFRRGVPEIKDNATYRLYYLNDCLSNENIKVFLKNMPHKDQLEGRATGNLVVSHYLRKNIEENTNEKLSFVQRWCLIL